MSQLQPLISIPSEPNDWPELIPWGNNVETTPYPIGKLPPIFRNAIQSAHEKDQAPIELEAMSAIASASAVIQGQYDVARSPQLTGPVSLMFLAIADSGERKSTADRNFTSIIRNYRDKLQSRYRDEIIQSESALQAWHAEISGVESGITAKAKKGDDTEAIKAKLVELQNNKPKPFLVPLELFESGSFEGVRKRLMDGWPDGYWTSDEGGMFFGSYGMKSENRMQTQAGLNKLWDGSALPVSLAGNPSYELQGARLTASFMVQPSVLREALKDGSMRGIGLLARFLVAKPNSLMGTRMYQEHADTYPNIDRFNKRIQELMNESIELYQAGIIEPELLHFTDDAKQHWVKFFNATEAELCPHGDLSEVKDIASKIAENAARLATVFQVFEHKKGPISLESMKAGTAVALWHLKQAIELNEEVDSSRQSSDAQALEKWIIRRCQSTGSHNISRRDVQQHIVPISLRKSPNLDTTLIDLEERGRVRTIMDGKKKLIVVRPELLEEK